MGKLTLKHLAPYLPYNVNIHFGGKKSTNILEPTIEPYTIKMSVISMMAAIRSDSGYKPILRPLSELIKPIEELNGTTEVENLECRELYNQMTNDKKFSIEFIPYQIMIYLFENHYDVFELIPNNLAIDINQV